MFASFRHVNIHNGAQPKTIMKLFNSLVTQLLLYNSEIWGAYVNDNSSGCFPSLLENIN